MSQVIRIPETLYKRLESYAQGFDTPANVIEKILDYYEAKNNETPISLLKQKKQTRKQASNLEIIYYPEGAEAFKQALLENKQAYIRLFKVDGTDEIKVWNASKFTAYSDISSNLRSGYLRSWRTKGIYKAVVAINKKDLA
ncbi:MAG: hypothetical protein JW927_00245 [Deltaproteobacteria bacterium]|nr:hypothetical protein [Deltaproteobacteria bacterium]